MLVGVIKFSAAFRTRSGQLRRKLKGILWDGARGIVEHAVGMMFGSFRLSSHCHWTDVISWRTDCGQCVGDHHVLPAASASLSLSLSLSVCLPPPSLTHTYTHRLVCFSFILFICGSYKKTAYTGNYADTWLARVPFFLRKLQRFLPAGRTGRRLSDRCVTVNFVAIWFFSRRLSIFSSCRNAL